MAGAVWKLQAAEGAGWVREVIDGAPIVTAVESQAQQFPSAEVAGAIAAHFPSRCMRFVAVARPAHEVDVGFVP